MTYSRGVGPLFVGLITSTKSTTVAESTINLDEFRTSRGLYSESTLTTTGLAYTDLTSSVGAGIYMYGQQAPKASTGYGADISRTIGALAIGGSIGCASLSNDPVIIRYAGILDSNDVITSSNVYII